MVSPLILIWFPLKRNPSRALHREIVQACSASEATNIGTSQKLCTIPTSTPYMALKKSHQFNHWNFPSNYVCDLSIQLSNQGAIFLTFTVFYAISIASFSFHLLLFCFVLIPTFICFDVLLMVNHPKLSITTQTNAVSLLHYKGLQAVNLGQSICEISVIWLVWILVSNRYYPTDEHP